MADAWTRFLDRVAIPNTEFTYDDISEWNPEEFESLVGAGLLYEIEGATRALCDACPEAHWEQVRWSKNEERAFITCPAAGIVAVESERLRRWHVSPSRLASLLTQVVSPSTDMTALLGSQIWFLGRRQIAGRNPRFFLAAIESEDLVSAASEIRRAYGDANVVLLVPFSPLQLGETHKFRVFDIRNLVLLRSGDITLDFDTIEDQFSNSHFARQVKKASRSLAHYRRDIRKHFMLKSGIERVDVLARKLGVTTSALYGMERGDTTRYSAAKLDSVLKKIGCTRAKWDRLPTTNTFA
jgi:hypothetical protein